MGSWFHSLANRLAALAMKLLFGSVAQIHVLRPENANRPGGLLLAANHISHFDPLIISAVVNRKIDWMAMAEFFPTPVVGFLLRAVDAFPADRDRANRATIREALGRLGRGRLVGIFPEGGIRDGERSILEGAQLRSGVAALSQLAGAPVLPCVILGTDRLYNRRRWMRLGHRTPVWIAFGNRVIGRIQPNEDKLIARRRIEQEFVAAVNQLRDELRETFALTETDMPHPPHQRMKEQFT
jgi:1-acyl-sn-glycerol-3-phosphate acyltransferase